ncbi:MAG TPA: hypothetical protein P5029_07250 [Methanolinea sp.]|nr:hypothetical protein [Methanolinea sp.]HRS93315.1 hypothetical protein [Methanolinea sp.]HRU80365.1 hypothetical protein [Methanolinea sp.]
MTAGRESVFSGGDQGKDMGRVAGLRSLAVSFRYIDTLLGTVEDALGNPSPRNRAFCHCIPDIPAAERERLEEGIRALRERLKGEMDRLGISSHAGAVPASRAVRADLATIAITLEELTRKDWTDLGWTQEGAGDLRSVFAGLQEMVGDLLDTAGSSGCRSPPGNEWDKRGGRHTLHERGEENG